MVRRPHPPPGINLAVPTPCRPCPMEAVQGQILSEGVRYTLFNVQCWISGCLLRVKVIIPGSGLVMDIAVLRSAELSIWCVLSHIEPITSDR